MAVVEASMAVVGALGAIGGWLAANAGTIAAASTAIGAAATAGTSIAGAVNAPQAPDLGAEEANVRREAARRALALQRTGASQGGGRRVLASMSEESPLLLKRPVLQSVNR